MIVLAGYAHKEIDKITLTENRILSTVTTGPLGKF